MERTWPLAGRDAELRAIADAIRPGAPWSGIVLAGPAGVGKTRLAREALAVLERRGARVCWAHGSTAARGFPLGAFAGLVDGIAGGAAPEVVPDAIDALLADGPLVLGVDDAHQLDELSALLVHSLVARRLATVVATIREGEPAPDSVTSLWKDEHLARLDVSPLSAEVTAGLVARVLGGPVESAAVQRFWSLTRGSPLFLRHLVTAEVASGRLDSSSGLWCWRDSPEISPELATIVRGQIGELTPGVRDVVDLVALAEPLDLAELGRLAGAPAIEEAEERDLIGVDDGGGRLRARLGHPMYGELRRAEMGRARARRLRGQAAAVLTGDEEELIPCAVLTLDSDLPPDIDLFLQAAGAALGMGDLLLAERLATGAVAAGGGFAATLTLASILSWLSRGEEAEQLLTDLVAAAPDDAVRQRVSAFRVGNMLWTLGRADEAEALLARALADATPGPGRVLVAHKAALDASRGRAMRALEVGRDVLADETEDPLAIILATSAVAAASAVTGRLQQLEDASTLGQAAARGTAASIPRFGLGDWTVLGYRLAGETEQALRAEKRLRAASETLPGPARLMALVIAGQAALAAGRIRDAIALLREARAGLEPSPHEFRFRCRMLLTAATALAGDAVAARTLLSDVERERHPAYVLFLPDEVLARAWVCAAEGAVTAAGVAAREAAALARAQDSPAYEVLAWQTAVQLGDPAGAADRLTDLAAVVDGPRAGAALAHATALAGQDGDALDVVSLSWEGLGDPVAAADAAAQASLAHRRSARSGSAIAAAARAQRLGEGCGAHTPAVAAAARPLPLTTREREVAVLAARGLTNREIADLLTVSIRTVEGHLYRAGHKLGISDRGDFTAFVGPSAALE